MKLAVGGGWWGRRSCHRLPAQVGQHPLRVLDRSLSLGTLKRWGFRESSGGSSTPAALWAGGCQSHR